MLVGLASEMSKMLCCDEERRIMLSCSTLVFDDSDQQKGWGLVMV